MSLPRTLSDHTPPITDHTGLGRGLPWSVSWRIGTTVNTVTTWDDLSAASIFVQIGARQYRAQGDASGNVTFTLGPTDTAPLRTSDYALLITPSGGTEQVRAVGKFIVGFDGAFA